MVQIKTLMWQSGLHLQNMPRFATGYMEMPVTVNWCNYIYNMQRVNRSSETGAVWGQKCDIALTKHLLYNFLQGKLTL